MGQVKVLTEILGLMVTLLKSSKVELHVLFKDLCLTACLALWDQVKWCASPDGDGRVSV